MRKKKYCLFGKCDLLTSNGRSAIQPLQPCNRIGESGKGVYWPVTLNIYKKVSVDFGIWPLFRCWLQKESFIKHIRVKDF